MKGDIIETRAARFLLNYRITPLATTGLSLAEMSRKLRSTFDLLLLDGKGCVLQKQMNQKVSHDKHCKLRSFNPEDVHMRNYGCGPKWIPALVETCTGPLSYTTVLENRKIVKRHVDQIHLHAVEEGTEAKRNYVPEQSKPGIQPSHIPESPETAADMNISVPVGEEEPKLTVKEKIT